MEYRQRRLIAAVILALSVVIVAYLIFYTPSESNIATPTPTAVDASGTPWTPLPSTPESDDKRTAEAVDAQQEAAPESEVAGRQRRVSRHGGNAAVDEPN